MGAGLLRGGYIAVYQRMDWGLPPECMGSSFDVRYRLGQKTAIGMVRILTCRSYTNQL